MKRLFSVILLSMTFVVSYSQRVPVYKQLDTNLIKVSASSELNQGSMQSAVNGDGMQGNYHAAHNLGHGMWLSKISKEYICYHESTHEGVVWFLCDFGEDK